MIDRAILLKKDLDLSVPIIFNSLENVEKSSLELDLSIADKLGFMVSLNPSNSLKDWYENLLLIEEDLRVSKIGFFDTETTGKIGSYIVSIAFVVYDINTNTITKKYYKEINPQIIMDQEVQDFHGITNEAVASAPSFTEVSSEILDIIESCDMLCAFNAFFDISVLVREFERSSLIVPNMYYLDLMVRLKEIVDARGVDNRKKNPKLKEAADFFGVSINEGNSSDSNNGFHNALYDTEVLQKTFELAIKNNFLKTF